MRWMTCFGVALVIGASAAVSAMPSMNTLAGERKRPAAQIDLEWTTYDLGTVIHRETVVVAFPFRNSGDAVLTLSPVFDEDGRLYTQLSSATVEPGASGTIEVFMTTEGLYGPVADSLAVLTNDPDRKKVFLELTANVQPVVAPFPAVVDIGEVGKDDSYRGMVRLIGILVDEGNLSGLRLESSSRFINGEITEYRSEAGEIPVIEFALAPDLQAGSIEQTIAITSEDPPAKAFLRVFGKKQGDISVTPEGFVIVASDKERVGSHSVVIESERSFQITEVEDLTEHLDISTRTIDTGSKYELVARLKDALQENAMGHILVHTDMKDQPLLEIPVTLAVRP